MIFRIAMAIVRQETVGIIVEHTFFMLFVGFVAYKVFIATQKTLKVEFDEEYLYIIEDEADTLVPLSNIKSVRLRSFFGVFDVTFHHPEKWGDSIYFKPSLMYPLNFARKDELVDLLRRNIEKARRTTEVFQKNALHS
jgi:hypothetical protein